VTEYAGADVVAVLLNLKSFGLIVLFVIAIFVAVSLLYRHPTRPCHRCGARVRLDRRNCQECGFEFEEIRGVTDR
jgi:predicted amidophosphoribosyltransferase